MIKATQNGTTRVEYALQVAYQQHAMVLHSYIYSLKRVHDTHIPYPDHMFCIVLNGVWDPKACTPVSCVSIWNDSLRVQKGELTLWDTHID